MCGIAGLIELGGAPPRAWLDIMLDSIVHRGPDGDGRFLDGNVALGMRRLAVIDIEGGNQPLSSRDGRVVAFQNGEIYNFIELRRELAGCGYRFASQSDTEVLAHGYDRWGIEGLLSRIDGMFALAILDRDTGQLHLARDRFGEKPLFYASDPTRFAFGSSLTAIGALPWVNDSIDPLSLRRYLALHYCPGRRTILQGVSRLLPGERLTLHVGDLAVVRQRYYVPALGEPTQVSDDELADLVEDAVASRLVADVPVGVFLSGGLDSSIICAIAARHLPHILTFSMGFASPQHDESSHAAAVARATGARHHAFHFDSDSFVRLLPQVADALDEPVGDQACLPLLHLCAEARKHATVVLSGEGADEVFGGYGYYPDAPGVRLADRALAAVGVRDAGGSLLGRTRAVTPSGFPLLTDRGDRDRLLGPQEEADDWEREMVEWLGAARDPLQRATAADVATWLPDDLLVKFDRMAMAVSLEGRAPYLAPRLAQVALRLPASERHDGRTSKVALRRVAQRWLPASILDRRKQGFVLPMRDWLRRWFEAAGGVRAWCSAAPIPLVQASELEGIVSSDIENGVQRERLLYALVLLAQWHQSAARQRAGLRARYNLAACSPIRGVDVTTPTPAGSGEAQR